MKRIIAAILAIAAAAAISGCSKQDGSRPSEAGSPATVDSATADSATVDSATEAEMKKNSALFGKFKNKFYRYPEFNKGTVLYIYEDGTFSGDYHYYSGSDTGADHPNGTTERSSFTGRLSGVTELDDYSYSMVVSEVELTTKTGAEEIREGQRFVNVDFTGEMSVGDEIILYTPDAPLEYVPSDFFTNRKPSDFPESERLGAYSFIVLGRAYYYSDNKG